MKYKINNKYFGSENLRKSSEDELQVNSVKRTCGRAEVTRKADWNVPLHPCGFTNSILLQLSYGFRGSDGGVVSGMYVCSSLFSGSGLTCL